MATLDPIRRARLALVFTAASFAITPGCSCSGDVMGHPRDGGGVVTDGASHDSGGGSPDSGRPPLGDIVLFAPGAPTDAEARFMDPPGSATTGRADLLYPLDGVLLPRNVFSPDVQWAAGTGAAGDLFRVRFTGGAATLTAYVLHSGASFHHDYVVDFPSWQALAADSAGRTLTLVVDRWSSATHTVVAGAPVHLRIARSGIAGAVYYWQLGAFGSPTEGRVIRVRQGTDVPPAVENFMPSPPIGGDGQRCAACHGLSRDGNHLAVSFDDGTFGGVADLTADLTATDPPLLFRFDRPWYYAAFSPDGSRILMTDPSQHAFLLNGATGAEVTPASGGIRDGTHPAWSPDGNQLALVIHADDAWNPTVGDLATMPVTAADTFGAAGMLHAGASLSSAPEGGSLDAYPTYSPDSNVVAFQHGTHTLVSAGGATGALYAIPRGGGTAARLDHASVGNSFYPNFTPFITPSDDGSDVYWLLYYTERDYGNELAGTLGSHRRQIWVSAVSTDLTRPDPSNVPYWLPGQDAAQQNASAYWAPVPCRATGDACTSSGMCCSAVCGPDGPGATCLPPTSCRMEGETCSAASDCCGASGLTCRAGICIGTLI